MLDTPTLSVVLPIYNESEAITLVLQELIEVLETRWPSAWELLAVNDGSTDTTSEKIRALCVKYPGLRLLDLEANVGQSGALWMGFQEAQSPWLATLDADGQNDPADLPGMMDELGDADAIFGYRANRQDTASKKFGSKLANGFRNFILKEEIRDTGCAIKIFRKSLTTNLTPWNGMHRFLGSLFMMQGAKIVQKPVNHRARSAGTSKYTNWGRLKKTWLDLFAVRWLRSRHVQVSVKES